MGFGYFNLGSNPRSPLYMVHGFGHVTSPFWVTQPHLPLRIYFSNCLLYSFSSSILPQIHYPLGLLQYRVLCLKHARNIVAERPFCLPSFSYRRGTEVQRREVMGINWYYDSSWLPDRFSAHTCSVSPKASAGDSSKNSYLF